MSYNYAASQPADSGTPNKISMFTKESGKRFLYTTAVATLGGLVLGERGTTTVLNMSMPNCLLVGSSIGVGAELGTWAAGPLEQAILGNQSDFARNFETQAITVAAATVGASLMSSYTGGLPFSAPLVGLAAASHIAGDWTTKNWDFLGALW